MDEVLYEPTRCIWGPEGWKWGDVIEFEGERYKVVMSRGNAGSPKRRGQNYYYIAKITSLEEILLGD